MGRFQDRIVQYPNRKKMKVLDDNGNIISEATVELTRYEGADCVQGSTFSFCLLVI